MDFLRARQIPTVPFVADTFSRPQKTVDYEIGFTGELIQATGERHAGP